MADPQLPKGYEDFKPSEVPLPKGYESFTPFGSKLRTKTDESKIPPGFFNPKTPPAPYLSNLGANALPMVGSAFGPGGTMIGTGVSQILKREFPKVFGNPADSVPIEGVKDLIVNNAIPAGIGSVVGLAAKGLRALPASAPLRNFPAVRQGAAQQMTEQIASQFAQPESQILESGAGKASGKLSDLRSEIKLQGQLHPPTSVTNAQGQQTVQFSPEVQAAMKDLEDTFGKNEVGKQLVRLQRQMAAGVDVAGSQTYKQIADTALRDLTHVRNWKLAAGEEGIEDLAINRLLTSGFKEKGLNSVGILAELAGKNREIYSEAIRPQTMSLFKDLINEIHAQQTGHGISDAVVRFSGNKLLWTALGIGHTLGFHMAASPMTLAAGGTILTNSMLARAMSNPETARVVVEALRTPASSQKGQIISHILQNVWKGGATVAETEAERQ